MIVTDLHQQTMRCTTCGDVHEIPRRVLRDPEQVLNLQEDVERDHRECVQYSDVRLAINARAVRKALEKEQARSKRAQASTAARRRAA